MSIKQNQNKGLKPFQDNTVIASALRLGLVKTSHIGISVPMLIWNNSNKF
jgi:hypothetical protein